MKNTLSIVIGCTLFGAFILSLVPTLFALISIDAGQAGGAGWLQAIPCWAMTGAVLGFSMGLYIVWETRRK